MGFAFKELLHETNYFLLAAFPANLYRVQMHICIN